MGTWSKIWTNGRRRRDQRILVDLPALPVQDGSVPDRFYASNTAAY